MPSVQPHDMMLGINWTIGISIALLFVNVSEIVPCPKDVPVYKETFSVKSSPPSPSEPALKFTYGGASIFIA
ncbi:hypothetical protein J7L67_08205 [bacterium]|nr:hypothetical protein [bacterium]